MRCAGSHFIAADKLLLIDVDSLKPTQLAVGPQTVGLKLKEIEARKADPSRLERYLAKRPIPAILGPKRGVYLIDHHHLARAIWEAGLSWSFVRMIHDFSCLEPRAFWSRMQDAGYVYTVDKTGRRCPLSRLPTHVRSLKPDPYRDLATLVRRRGGFKKTERPFSEFSWAAYFRTSIPPRLLKTDMSRAVKEALELSRAPRAAHLPGFMGH
jgi:hypothetical protein